MARYLVIVESPAKVKTIKKFLGSNYVVTASNGHVRDLPKSSLGIDVEHDFYEGDEHYEEYLEAQQAIAEGMSIYSGSIAFEENAMAEYAERLWEDMEQMDQKRFRRINTMLEE